MDRDPTTIHAVKWTRLHPASRQPAPGYQGDAGYDLYVCREVKIPAHFWKPLPIGIALEMPPDVWGLITGRSSAIARDLLVIDSVIDSGFRGELFVRAMNLSGAEARIEPGDRIGQIVLIPNLTIDWKYTTELAESERGSRGFGSTGA